MACIAPVSLAALARVGWGGVSTQVLLATGSLGPTAANQAAQFPPYPPALVTATPAHRTELSQTSSRPTRTGLPQDLCQRGAICWGA